jgi:hypothetical protein
VWTIAPMIANFAPAGRRAKKESVERKHGQDCNAY